MAASRRWTRSFLATRRHFQKRFAGNCMDRPGGCLSRAARGISARGAPGVPGDIAAGIGDALEGPALAQPALEGPAEPFVEAIGHGAGADPPEGLGVEARLLAGIDVAAAEAGRFVRR